MAKAVSIFKYRDFSKSSLELLINRELWFAKPDSLNDPFECQMIYPEVMESVWRHHRIPEGEKKRIEQLLTLQLSNVGICAFSRTRQNQLMWAHYAEEHKGFCIGFNEQKLKSTSPRFHSQDIEYKAKLPYHDVIKRIKWFEKFPGANEANSIAGDILSSITGTKYTNWKYEREVRLMRHESGAMPFEPSAVKSIAFGLRMTDRDKATLRRVLSGQEWRHLLWFEATKAKDKFGLKFEKYNKARKQTCLRSG